MKTIFIPKSEGVILVNKMICEESNSPHHCYDIGKIESAIHSVFYPGSYPFAAGDIAHIAAALCFYLIKTHAFVDDNKRTAALVTITFLNQNEFDLKYSVNLKSGINDLAKIVDKCAAGKVTKEKLMNWFENHTIILD